MAVAAAARTAAVAALQPVPSDATRTPSLDAYTPIAVDYGPASEADWALIVLIGRLRAAVSTGDMRTIAAALADDLVVADCDNDATRSCPASRQGTVGARPAAAQAPAEQRLLQSLCCADMRPRDIPRTLRVDTALEVLGSAMAGGTIGPDPDSSGSVCAPAQPLFDRQAAERMAVAADTDPQNLRVTARELVLRNAPRADAPESGRIAAGRIVPMVTDLPQPLPDGWSAAALPNGTLGYTDARNLDDLVVTSACFAKDATGDWRIRTVIRRHAWGGPG